VCSVCNITHQNEYMYCVFIYTHPYYTLDVLFYTDIYNEDCPEYLLSSRVPDCCGHYLLKSHAIHRTNHILNIPTSLPKHFRLIVIAIHALYIITLSFSI